MSIRGVMARDTGVSPNSKTWVIKSCSLFWITSASLGLVKRIFESSRSGRWGWFGPVEASALGRNRSLNFFNGAMTGSSTQRPSMCSGATNRR